MLDLRLMGILNITGLDEARVVSAAASALRGGITCLQLRAKQMPGGELARLIDVVAPRCHAVGVTVLVNDRPDVARATAADGAHVGPEDLPPRTARRVLGAKILGVSARNLDRMTEAEAASADYVGVGALRLTASKPEATALGLAGIRRLARTTAIPVVAIGGIVPDDLPALRAAGVVGVAVLSGVFDQPDPEAAARRYRSAWDR